MKPSYIEKLIRDHGGEITAHILDVWMRRFNLTATDLAAKLPANKRSIEAWRAGRYKIPLFLWRALRDIEKEKENNCVTPLTRATPWLRAAQHKISELTQLQENWDSYGSPPIQPSAIEQASESLKYLSVLHLPHPQIFPVPGGGLQIEFQQEGRELEIEFLPDGSIEYLMVATDNEMREGSILPSSSGDLYRLAFWLQGKQAAALQV